MKLSICVWWNMGNLKIEWAERNWYEKIRTKEWDQQLVDLVWNLESKNKNKVLFEYLRNILNEDLITDGRAIFRQFIYLLCIISWINYERHLEVVLTYSCKNWEVTVAKKLLVGAEFLRFWRKGDSWEKENKSWVEELTNGNLYLWEQELIVGNYCSWEKLAVGNHYLWA